VGALAQLAVQRVLLGDRVAAAKFGTGEPIEDPVRERELLESVNRLSAVAGIDPALSGRFFADQFEANKVVQRGLYELWTAHPDRRPLRRPDLATEVRPQLDRITTQMIAQLAVTVARRCTRHPEPDTANLDALHIRAVWVALRSLRDGERVFHSDGG
jgi:chorismate mutase